MSFDEREYARKRAKARQQSSWFKLAVGDNTFRILPTPPTKTVKTNFFEYAVHREVGPNKQTVRCGIDPVIGDGECWLCDVKIPSLKKKKMDSRASALAPKAQLLVQVASVDDDGKMTGPLLFTPSKQVADQLLGSIFGSKKRSYVDPLKGFNISINRTGTGKNDTRYGILEPDQEPTKVPQTLLDKVKPFESLKEVPIYSQAKQQAAYTGQQIPEDEEEEEQRPKSNKNRKPVVEEEDADEPEAEDEDSAEDEADADEDAEEEAEEEDEDEPAPPPKKKPATPPAKPKKKPAPVEDEEEEVPDADEDAEDESEEVEDEEDEPAPPAKKKPAATPPAKVKKKPAPVEEEAEEDEADPEDEIDLDEVEEEAEEEDEDEPAPPPKKKPATPPAKPSKPAAKPSPKPKPRR